jgi:hypothetical protein
MVEDYGQVLQPYADKLKKAEKRIEKFTPEQLEKYKLPDGKIVVRLADVCPPPKGWIRIDWTDNRFVNISIGVIYRPAEPINPLLWFGIFGNASLQRKPEENESLMCYYVLLAIIHDVELKQPTDRPLFSDKYEGKWFQRNKFCEDVWAYYHYPNQDPSLLYHSATPQEKLLQLNRAFERVQADLAGGGKTGKAGDKKPSRKKVVAIIVSVVIFLAALTTLILNLDKITEKYFSQKVLSSQKTDPNLSEIKPENKNVKEIQEANAPANYDKTLLHNPPKIIDPNRNSP